MRHFRSISVLAGWAFLLAALGGCAGGGGGMLEELLRAAGGAAGAGGVDTQTAIAGLREALQVGTERTVAATSRTDGYLGNPLIRIPLPDRLESVASGLRTVGFGQSVDDLEVAMNRAAERAASEATPVFVSAIRGLTFSDASSILNGGERAATDYFEGRTRLELADRFAPIVENSMQQVGLVQAYDQMVGQVSRIPFITAPQLDLRSYVTDRGLDGLFAVLAQEEARIRQDPAARTTELLRSVFGGR